MTKNALHLRNCVIVRGLKNVQPLLTNTKRGPFPVVIINIRCAIVLVPQAIFCFSSSYNHIFSFVCINRVNYHQLAAVVITIY